jgi:putative ABC transport system substrate-binding protein
MLRELVPAARIYVLINPTNSNATLRLKEIEEASRTLGLQTQIVSVGTGDDIDTEFASLNARGAGGLLVVDDPLFNDLRTKLVTLAARHRIPTIYFQGEFVREGGLISYATSYAEQFRQIGIYTGQILKGAKPGDLPVMQPTKFELVINTKTAKALGLNVPEKLRARADEVSE